ncbi:MAG: HAD family hydrolase [Planctomycetes bacterium]|nr:HAD family hydrolase [Planctomycetota bacterium]
MDLLDLRFWIFDLDGTLTVPTHDFEELREELELPPGLGILEALAELPAELAAERHRRLELWERRHAHEATAQPGAAELLIELGKRGARRGVLTRNTWQNAWLTLEACGLGAFFDPSEVLGREAAAAKPSPDGVIRLLTLWGARPEEAVMAGDFVFDLEAGRAAGVRTLYLDGSGAFPHRALADHAIRAWTEVLER